MQCSWNINERVRKISRTVLTSSCWLCFMLNREPQIFSCFFSCFGPEICSCFFSKSDVLQQQSSPTEKISAQNCRQFFSKTILSAIFSERVLSPRFHNAHSNGFQLRAFHLNAFGHCWRVTKTKFLFLMVLMLSHFEWKWYFAGVFFSNGWAVCAQSMIYYDLHWKVEM